MKTRMDVKNLVSVQPFWEASKLNSGLLFDDKTGAPMAVAYELQADSQASGLTCVPGIGLVGILFSLDPNDPRAMCCGALNKSKKVSLYEMSKVFSLQCFPGEFTRIFGVPSNELADSEIPLEDLLHAGTIAEEIACAETFAERMDLAKSFMRKYEARTREREIGKMTQAMMLDILQNHGDVRMSELEEQTGYSARYLQKVILEQVGLAPKTALSNIRFQNALRIMMENPNLGIAEIAQSSGYYDQSHFTKAFKEYMSMTPANFQEQLRRRFSTGQPIKK